MLTATYALASLQVAQANMRRSLLAYQQQVHGQLQLQHGLTLAQVQLACDTLDALSCSWHWRQIETYLMPAIRHTRPDAAPLLDELGQLNTAAQERVRSLRCQAADQPAEQVCAGIDSVCGALLTRVDKEERELFGLARRVIDGDGWFSIAHQFLRHDAQRAEARRLAAAPADGDDERADGPTAVRPGPPAARPPRHAWS